MFLARCTVSAVSGQTEKSEQVKSYFIKIDECYCANVTKKGHDILKSEINDILGFTSFVNKKSNDVTPYVIRWHPTKNKLFKKSIISTASKSKK